jgi:uncharacterized protein YjbI with pentapeptide repeats
MANDKHAALLKQGVAEWNTWRYANPREPLDLSQENLSGADLGGANLGGANLSRACFQEANLSGANLGGANLSRAYFREANLSGVELVGADLRQANLEEADLSWANLRDTNLSGANLRRANLREANLRRANLSGLDLKGVDLVGADLFSANLSGADLKGANLQSARLLRTDLTGADLTGCQVYGVSAWDIKLEGTKQQNLVITGTGITVDSIEVAQFVYLLLHNENIRSIIDTVGRKGVLLLGRFTEGRIEILEKLREKFRCLGFVPMVFNFDKPETKDFTETVRLLANLSHFVIVDITNPRSTPLELQATVPDYMVPFVPILEQGQAPFAMFRDLQNKYDWVLDVREYASVDRLIEGLEDGIIRPAEAKFNELLARRTKQLRVVSL